MTDRAADRRAKDYATIKVDPAAHDVFKLAALRRGVTMRALFEELVGERFDAEGWDRGGVGRARRPGRRRA